MKANNIFKFIFIILVILFVFLIVACKSGYYEYELSEKKNLTDQAIKRFEEDVASGKNIDINDYLDNKAKDYSNKISNLGNKVSDTIESVFSKGIGYVFKYINKELDD